MGVGRKEMGGLRQAGRREKVFGSEGVGQTSEESDESGGFGGREGTKKSSLFAGCWLLLEGLLS